MSFAIDTENLTITGRVGESLEATFNFQEDIKNMCIEFVILEKMGTKPLIRKTYKNPQENFVKVNLSAEELIALTPNTDVQKTYCWGLILHIGKSFSSIIIPKLFEQAPKFVIYPGIENCEEEINE